MLKPMLWETFFELMRAQNFLATRAVMEEKYPVKFYPPSYANPGPANEFITFHKRHIIDPLALRVFAKRLKRRCGINPDFLLLSAGMQWEIKEPTAPVRSSRPLFKPVAQISSISLLPAEQTTPLPTDLHAESLHSEKEKKRAFMSKSFGGSMVQKDEPKRPKSSQFSALTKKSTQLMHQLLGTSKDKTKGLASMKWEHFVKLMREMGFESDLSTSGSSVRFDPPDPKDVSITFHRPHPDPTIHPVMLREFAKKLKRNYGWSEADLLPLSN
ncbi:hypothetical protein DFH08DRAFT_205406 [Mycena albidolilacea]|uniref:Type II toxin-antitoxin system HicA family toxin n=1 Tax=Mycena albidolilacea TaxID=1033008 RepID=A0AAD7A0D0_9AGAR|nr:hypothetical protein DFH08DRAFT_205406 [Mycena albidolilacea]